jgi:hypothetical protein
VKVEEMIDWVIGGGKSGARYRLTAE